MNLDNSLEKRFRRTQFLTSAARLDQCPATSTLEIAFVGRSNVGKSSVINCLCNQKRLAKTSKTPGRTQLINFFQADEALQLIDLPGYGYAKVSRSQQEAWSKEITRFLNGRASLSGLILILDIRHPMRDTDEQLLSLAAKQALPVHILLNKADKLSRNQAQSASFKLQKQLAQWSENQPNSATPVITVQPFSAEKRQGLDAFFDHIQTHWIAEPEQTTLETECTNQNEQNMTD
jgi:GTP-binding protein